VTGSRQRQIPEHPVIKDMERFGYIRQRRWNPPVTAYAVPPPFRQGRLGEIQGEA